MITLSTLVADLNIKLNELFGVENVKFVIREDTSDYKKATRVICCSTNGRRYDCRSY